MNEAALLNRLKAEQQKYALEALKNPGAKTEYEFGLRVGYNAGLECALGVLLKMLDEERNGDRDL